MSEAKVYISKPPVGKRGGTINWDSVDTKVYPVQSFQVTASWGLDPGQGNLVYLSNNAVTVGTAIKLTIGDYLFSGVCESDIPLISSRGNNRALCFKDYRKWLAWDKVYCSFNNIDDKLIDGCRKRRYWHIRPNDFFAYRKTWTNAPYSAADILRMVLYGPGIETPWTFGYLNAAAVLTQDSFHPNHALPVYEVDAMSGKALGTLLSDICDQLGLLFTIMPTIDKLLNIVFAQKGVDGPDVTFPANSDNRQAGIELSGNPTRVRILGDRNLYQVHDITMVPNWNTNWNQFYDVSILTQWVFDNLITWNQIADPEQIVARQQALAKALEMTVWQFDAANGDTGAFLDFRKYGGKARNNMPAALYIRNLLFRSFSLPDNFTIRNTYGQTLYADSLEIQDKLIAKVEHDPISGLTTYDASDNVDGNCYVIVKGYQVGKDMFETIKPERFNLTEWLSAQDIWQKIEAHIEDTGEPAGQCLIFDEPVIRSEDLVTMVDGFAVFQASPTITVPPVRATLTFAGEKFSWFQQDIGDPSSPPSDPLMGTQIHDDVLNIGGLSGEFIDVAGASLYEVYYADGKPCRYKAVENANNFLKFQWTHTRGSFRAPITDGVTYKLHGKIDRITLNYSPQEKVVSVSLTNERQRLNYVPEKDLTRYQQLNSLLPGQADLKREAGYAKKIAAAVGSSKDAYSLLADAFHGNFGEVEKAKPVVVTQTINPVRVGTPFVTQGLVRTGSSPLQNTRAFTWNDTADPNYTFVGVSVRENEPVGTNGATLKLQSEGVAIVTVKGPVAINDFVGFKSGEGNVVGLPTQVIGKAQQAIPAGATKRIKVLLGIGKSTGSKQLSLKSVQADYLTCTGGGLTGDIYVAKPYTLRHLASRSVEGATVTYAYSGRANNLDGQRTADDGTESEKQIVIPVWAAGDKVYAVYCEQATGLTDPVGQPITLVAIEDGRAWARLKDQDA